MDWKHLLAYISGSVEEELLLRIEYLVAENRILRDQITGRLRLTDGRTQDVGRNRQKAQQAGPGRSGQHRQARHDPGLAPQAGGPEV